MIVRWSAHFHADLKSIYDFISGRSQQGARRVVERVFAAADRLSDMPAIGRPGQAPGTREFVVATTPYIIVYEVGGADVVLLRLLHGAQRWPPADDR
ncbi:MAG: type II toxin-antitoxin system RelE/ParE family toxin [Caulobacterales bacterium]